MIQFGPSGSSIEFSENPAYKGTVDMPRYVRSLGLDCFEYSFGKGVRIGTDTALQIGEAFAQAGVEISVHAPYFINFANPDPEKIANSNRYLLESLQALRAFGGHRCVFHPGSPMKRSRDEAFEDMYRNLVATARILHEAGFGEMRVCPETMGKINQMGTVEEVAKLCTIDPIYTPCVDFGHVNARGQGCLKTQDDFRRVIDTFAAVLDWDRVSNMHIHFSKIEYTAMGEKCHLTMDDTQYGPEFEPLAKVLCEYNMTPYIVSESAGTQGKDAKLMYDIYWRIRNERA